MSNAVFCIAKSQIQAEAIVHQLDMAGFAYDGISVLFPARGFKDFAGEHHKKKPEGAAPNAGTGGVVMGIVGLLAGVGSLAIRGAGSFIAAGPIMTALSRATVGAALGGISRALIAVGIPEYEAKRYAGKIKKGKILISVHTQGNNAVSGVKEIFEQSNAEDVSSTSQTGIEGTL